MHSIKSGTDITVAILEFIPNTMMITTIFIKANGKLSVVSAHSDEITREKTSPHDSFAQIVEGNAEIIINKESHLLLTGRSIIIPAHAPNYMRSNWRFKMILTSCQNAFV